jgi:hypothetical protein
MPKAGRNDTCPCGSGKKYKKCCEAKAAAQSKNTTMMLIVAGAILVMIVLGLALRDRGPGEGRVWSEEHGHYHAP